MKEEDAIRRLSVEILLETGNPAEVILAVLMFSKDLVGWLRTRILETLQTFGDDVLKPAAALFSTKMTRSEPLHWYWLKNSMIRDWWVRFVGCSKTRIGGCESVLVTHWEG